MQVGPKEHLECHVEATNEEEPGDHEDLCDSQLGVEVECIDSLCEKNYMNCCVFYKDVSFCITVGIRYCDYIGSWPKNSHKVNLCQKTIILW